MPKKLHHSVTKPRHYNPLRYLRTVRQYVPMNNIESVSYRSTVTAEEFEAHVLRVMAHGCTRQEAESAIDSLEVWTGAFTEGQDGR